MSKETFKKKLTWQERLAIIVTCVITFLAISWFNGLFADLYVLTLKWIHGGNI